MTKLKDAAQREVALLRKIVNLEVMIEQQDSRLRSLSHDNEHHDRLIRLNGQRLVEQARAKDIVSDQLAGARAKIAELEDLLAELIEDTLPGDTEAGTEPEGTTLTRKDMAVAMQRVAEFKPLTGESWASMFVQGIPLGTGTEESTPTSALTPTEAKPLSAMQAERAALIKAGRARGWT